MAAPANLISLLRTIVQDEGVTQTYTDTQLSKLLISSAIFVRMDVVLRNSYTIDLTAQTIDPDPTIYPNTTTPDDNFTTLILFKSACLLAKGELRSKGGKNIIVKDGPNFYDGTKIGQNQQLAVNEFCDAYDDAKFQYAAGTLVGHAIIGPFRLGYYNDLPPGWYSPRRGS